jgi:hypothetical protein
MTDSNISSSSNNKISYLVNSQVPFFVRNDHPNFVRILESYYEFLEQQGYELDTLKNMRQYNDVDTSIDLFLQKFYDSLLKFIPKETSVDKTLIVKHIKDFYRSRGTEKSARFLMRVLFNEEIDSFYYPKKDVLRASDGKWYVEKSIKVFDVKVNGVINDDLEFLNSLANRRITGNTSNAYAVVENVKSYFDGGALALVREIKISNVVRAFIPGESVYITYDDNGIEKILTANIFSGTINTVQVLNPGTGYSVGDLVPVDSNTGKGGIIFVSSVSTGNVTSLRVIEGGAGFRFNDPIFFSGGGGSGGSAIVTLTNDDSSVHPNTYNIVSSTISLEANTPISNSVYSNLNNSNANTTIANAVNFFLFANTGPIRATAILVRGDNYTSAPSAVAVSNNIVRSLGILGAMRIVDGGLNYSVGDTITFTNVDTGYGKAIGTGAAANVTAVAANGRIQQVRFVSVPGHIVGGSGYSQFTLPKASVNSANGNGANIIVTTLLGLGESLLANSGTIGSISTLTISSRGSGYVDPPTINLTSIGDGTAQAVATIITGSITYPGRYLNDDGHLSGYNFIQNRDYYQNFSYVLRLKRAISEYRQAMKELIHPAGMKLFGEFLYEEVVKSANVISTSDVHTSNNIYAANYSATSNANGKLVIVTAGRDIYSVTNTYLNFTSANTLMPGTVSANNGNGNTTILIGTGTNFTTLKAGDNIIITGLQNTFTVGTVSNNTILTVASGNLPPRISGNTYSKILTIASANLADGIYSASRINSNSFQVYTANTVMAGTVSANSGNGNTTTLMGTGTNFTILRAGDNIRIAGLQNVFTVGAVSNSTQLYVTGGSLPKGITGNTYSRIFYSANATGTIYFNEFPTPVYPIPFAGATLDINLRENWMANNSILRNIPGTSSPYIAISNGSFTRASAADWLNVAGNGLETQAANNVLRRGPVRGGLFEVGSTFAPTRSDLAGVVAGSPGTLPWGTFDVNSGYNSAARTIALIAPNIVRLTLSGTSTVSNASLTLFVSSTSPLAATQGQTVSTYIALAQQAGTGNPQVSTTIVEEAAGNNYLTEGGSGFYTLTSTLQPFVRTRVIQNAATVTAYMALRVTIPNIGAWSITLDVSLQTLHTGLPTSPMLTGSSGTVTRAADRLRVPYAAGASGTIVVIANENIETSSSFGRYVQLDTGDNANRLNLVRGNADGTVSFGAAGTGSGGVTIAAALGRKAIAAAYGPNDLAISVNGSAVAKSGTHTTPPGLSTLWVGSGRNGSEINGFIERVIVFPTRLSDATLRQYSTLNTWGG